MYGLSCLDMSQRKPSCVSIDVRRLQGMAACSYGPGFCIDDCGGADAAASEMELELEEDVSFSSGGASGAGGGISIAPGGGRGGASHFTLDTFDPILYSFQMYVCDEYAI